MFSFLLIFLAVNVSGGLRFRNYEAAHKLTFPLWSVDSEDIEEYGEFVHDMFVDFMNEDEDAEDIKIKMCPQGTNGDNTVYIVDGVEYKSFSQAKRVGDHYRDFFKDGSCEKSDDEEITTTVVSANSVEIRGCFKMETDLEFYWIFDASQEVKVCGKRIHTFSDDMELNRIEIIADGGKGAQLIRYLVHSTMSTILPEEKDENGVFGVINAEKKLWRNPVFIVTLLLAVNATLAIVWVIRWIIKGVFKKQFAAKEITTSVYQ